MHADMVLEYIDGISLQELLSETRLSALVRFRSHSSLTVCIHKVKCTRKTYLSSCAAPLRFSTRKEFRMVI
jgi:hypothetical protein